MSNVDRERETLRKNLKEIVEIIVIIINNNNNKTITEMKNSFDWLISSLDTFEDRVRINELLGKSQQRQRAKKE